MTGYRVRGLFARVLSVAVAMAAAIPAKAQTTPQNPPALTWDARLDAIVASETAIHAGLAFAFPLGTYVRVGFGAAAGFMDGSPSGRMDTSARFLLDPFRESRWGPYAGGGVSTRFDDGRDMTTYLLLFFGVEGPISGRFSPAFELGLGGGARIGVILRRGAAERR
ncbi:MAG TPA: hypothetical protein VM939_09695 [Gemmatimonadaceae bacterium]|nr:hypothetical protein [Gemmatimonadaceae bacterium]